MLKININENNDQRTIAYDPRRSRRSKRTLQFATKVTPEFDQKIREIAFQKRLYVAEVLEAMLEAYMHSENKSYKYGSKEREREQSPPARPKNKKLAA